MNSFIHRTDAIILGLILFVAMILMFIAGKVIGARWNKERPELKGGVNTLFGALFGLSGLILAFTFGMSNPRLQRVRTVVEDEANEIGTAIHRSDLYPDTVRDGFRADFKNYLEAVIAYYENPTNLERRLVAKDNALKARDRLWSRAAQQSKVLPSIIPSQQMIPALNGMFDIAQTREIVLKARIPDLVLHMLFVCLLAGCFVAGYTSYTFDYRDWIIVGGFVLVTAMVVYTTIDLSRPLRGLIQDDAGQEALREMRHMFAH